MIDEGKVEGWDDRDRALGRVLTAIKNPLVMMSVVDRAEIYALVDRHEIKLTDVLDLTVKRARGR